jgi:hypothetical protein
MDIEGNPHFWTAVHMMKQSIPRLIHKYLDKLANWIILLQDNVPCHGMMRHAQASCIQPELFPIL